MSDLPGALARHPDLHQWLAIDAADELDLDPQRVRVRTAHTGVTPNEFITAGSKSVEDSGSALRQACAHARRLILARAGERLGTAAAELTLEIRIDEQAPAPPPERQPRLDLPAKIAGEGVFVQDRAWPDMLHARVVRPPTWAHRLGALDEPAVPDGHDLRLLRDGSFLAVTGADEYAVVRHAERVAAAYTRLHLMHASLAPSAAAALWTGGNLTVWSHSQGVELLKRTLAEVLDVDRRVVTVIHHQGAGAYGHNGADDAALDAALCALQHPDRPVLLKYTRQQEHRWEPFGPAMRIDMAAALDDAGRIRRWSHEVWSYTHAGRPIPRQPGSQLAGAWLREHAIDPPPAEPRLGPEVGIHRNAWPIYALAEPRVIKRFVGPGPLRTSSLRSLGAHGNVFAIESFMDELAALAGKSPVAFRLDHLDDPRARAVLEAVDDLCGGVAGPRGVALARYKNQQTWAAVVAEVEIDETRVEVRVPKVWIAADAGRVVDPDGLINQLEGGAVQAASWTLKERVRFDRQDIDSEDWDSYPVLRFDEVPEVVTRLIDRPDQPSLGAGEATQGPTAAAIANAVFAASGVRVRDMPLDADALRRAAAA